MVATSKFGLLTIRRHTATRKHLFLYPHGYRSGLRKPQKDKHQHKIKATTSVHLPKSVSNDLTIKSDSVFTTTNRKRWGARLVDVIKHLSHKTFL